MPDMVEGSTYHSADAGGNLNELGVKPAADDESLGQVEQQPTQMYGSSIGQLNFKDQGFDTKAKLLDDGRLNIDINQKSRLSNLVASALREPTDLSSEAPPPLEGFTGPNGPPALNVVIQVVGSRGDVQPFVALGRTLKESYGHRVRLATHRTFKSFVEENGLEFFSIGGDPAELMAFMVKNPGLLPGKDSLKSGDVGKRRKGMYEIFLGCWSSCIELGDGTGSHDPSARPFVADAIIANPPSFAHIHCAEKLGIPLHLMFTMPWSTTKAFPHPLANIQSSNTDPRLTNSFSYALVETMTWQGLGDLINQFRHKVLGLDSVNLLRAPGMENRLRIPYTYCWSPALIPKPNDWGPHIDVSGFYFLSLAGSFTPPPDLQTFLDTGPPPVYIGFGSIVVDDPNAMTKLIFEAVELTGQRALVSKGWGGLGADELGIPEGVFMLGDVPHDWLFKHVSCVVHHGGAGTTAAGIASGKPTVVVPFFGDQPFWGAMIARAGAGPLPVPYKKLTAEILAAGIRTCLEPRTIERAEELGAKISSEKGTNVGAQSFHRNLDIDALRCTICTARAAVWRIRRTSTKLSAFAATTLCNQGLLNLDDLKLYRPKEYFLDDGSTDPISAPIMAALGAAGTGIIGVMDLQKVTYRAMKSKTDQPRPAETYSTEKEHSVIDASPDSDSMKGKLASEATSSSSSGPNNQSGSQRFLNTASMAGRKTAGTGLKILTDILVNTAQGFHNAPRLYNDRSVRQGDKVTDLQSGLKAAGKGFALGLYDGYSGMFTQPFRGAREGGVTGFMKGIGKGLGGFFLKPSAAGCALPGYALQGIYEELRIRLGPGVQNSIIAARTAQGLEEWDSSTREEQQEVLRRWQHVQTKPESKSWKSILETQVQILRGPGDKKKVEITANGDTERATVSETGHPDVSSAENTGFTNDPGNDPEDFGTAIK
ncbi:MAG: hypothetical protein Q9192_004742 [Flavoplaca navasiana]